MRGERKEEGRRRREEKGRRRSEERRGEERGNKRRKGDGGEVEGREEEMGAWSKEKHTLLRKIMVVEHHIDRRFKINVE